MRELTSIERQEVNGGIIPLIIAAVAVVALAGCATTGTSTCSDADEKNDAPQCGTSES